MFLAAVWALTAAQRFGGSSPSWLELSRFLPYPLLLAPAGLAVLAAWPLGTAWRIASLATLALVSTVGMGLSWGGGEPAPAGASTVRLMTWNAKTVQASERPGGIAALLYEVAVHQPDVVVMQDANALRHVHTAAPTVPMFGLPFFWAEGQYLVASRFPLDGCGQLNAEGLLYARCTVQSSPPFDLVTVHFESPRAGLLAARREGIEGVGTWQANLAQRIVESQALARAIAAAPPTRPLVVAGDLNAEESSEVVQQLLATGLRDAFSAAGRGYGYTYGHTLRPAFSFLRIDHILVGPGVVVRDCEVGTAAASDHRPVIATLAIAPPTP